MGKIIDPMSEREIAKEIQKVGVAYSESSFRFLEPIINSMQVMLTRIAWWDLQLNEDNRKDTYKAMAEVINNLNQEIPHLKIHIGLGNRIANSLYNTVMEVLSYAKTLQSLCKTGNFQQNGWNMKKKMFDDFRTVFDKRIDFLEDAYKQCTTPEAKNEVLDALMHKYINPYHDSIGDMQKGAYR